jgi:hypothetical protein
VSRSPRGFLFCFRLVLQMDTHSGHIPHLVMKGRSSTSRLSVPSAAGETRKGGGREQQKWRGPPHRLKRKGGRPLRFLLKKESLRQVEKRDTHARTVLCLFLEVKTAAFGFHREMTSRYVGAFFSLSDQPKE